ncbi:hypothetical protein [Streptomyces sp. NBC_01092]|uniref:hypothetical protein n=1 Tax=Streptomyces sp. NBC_01092 TaxID=2903748 RepID=UPI003865C999|nr:hypothetical protein OG254_32980 [Streptomyces sp. NBC_01092]
MTVVRLSSRIGEGMRKLAQFAAATVALAVTLPLTAGEALAAEQGVEALATGSFSIHTRPTEKTESDQKFTKRGTGKVKCTLTYKEYNNGIGVRLITCGGDWRSLTEWIDFKKDMGDYYTFDKKVKDGQCFRIQAGRSWAKDIKGKVKY